MLISLVFLQQGNVKNSEKLMKIVNIKGENLHVFWTTWGILVKFPGKIWLMIILNVTKKQGFTIFLENTFSDKQQGWIKLPLSLLRVKNCKKWMPPYQERGRNLDKYLSPNLNIIYQGSIKCSKKYPHLFIKWCPSVKLPLTSTVV